MRVCRFVLRSLVCAAAVFLCAVPALAASSEIVDRPPVNPPFYGSVYVTGESEELGTITFYLPYNYRSGCLGLTRDGYLMNVTSSSMSGHLPGVYNDSISFQAFSLPRYRRSSGSNNEYIDLHIRPTASNADIATEARPAVSSSDILPYVSILISGVILVCCLIKSRR